ncbi:uncharacterized protein A4U43_C03F16950 [Asparagus officinalis]|uniref:Uncharacterized protein n=1 Tax=Asparagus officinalis TaxID=4686 RepID=A0A5P1FF03_ASPOF|nr:uncharacterized protein A4U43_C03F16950 [Asparagus officinalis]
MEIPSTLASSSRNSSPLEFNNNNNLRDDSFSSYLALMKQSFSDNDLASSNPRRSSLGTIIPPTTRASKDNGELDVFGAEKYFSGTLDIQDSPEVLTFDSISKLSERTKKPSTRQAGMTEGEEVVGVTEAFFFCSTRDKSAGVAGKRLVLALERYHHIMRISPGESSSEWCCSASPCVAWMRAK